MWNILQRLPEKTSKLCLCNLSSIQKCVVRSVGIGSDFDGIGETPHGLEDVSKYPALVSPVSFLSQLPS